MRSFPGLRERTFDVVKFNRAHMPSAVVEEFDDVRARLQVCHFLAYFHDGSICYVISEVTSPLPAQMSKRLGLERGGKGKRFWA